VIAMPLEEQLAALAWLATHVVVLSSSGFVVRWLLGLAGQAIPPGERDPGAVIGKLENVLVVALVSLGEFTALAVVFGLKGIVRVQHADPKRGSYYILGTLANFTWSLAVALLARWLLERIL
jgi:hypothetical protein